jgi:hypothetical protein
MLSPYQNLISKPMNTGADVENWAIICGPLSWLHYFRLFLR